MTYIHHTGVWVNSRSPSCYLTYILLFIASLHDIVIVVAFPALTRGLGNIRSLAVSDADIVVVEQ